ncbi:ABC transporter C family member 8 [Punica granatum]|uniref:ABC-type xenobiotic transporter n=2 Tax=Punica granatum TaxID=22663 RepID=A0A6P8D2U0_PUNGR|nr:ABC transporter C family member 8 [Punica granatum]
MALLRSFSGMFSWMCDGEEFNLGSSCSQRSILEAVNLLFISAFFVSLLRTAIKKQSRIDEINYKRDWVSVLVSILCALISLPIFGLSLWTLISEKTDRTGLSSWLLCFLKGLSWASLSLSLVVVRRTKWMKALCTVWWFSFSFLITALNIETLLNSQSFGILDSISWPVCFLLLVCAFRNYTIPIHQPALDPKLSEPLLVSEPEGRKSELGYASFLSKLVFCWVNPFLKSGYLKPLEFEDIPNLVSEDEANLTYQNFARTWNSLTKEGSSTSETNMGNLVIKAIIRVHLKENILIGFYAFLRTISLAVSPLILYAFINYSSQDEEENNLSQGFIIVGCLIVSKLVESLSQRHWFFGSRRSGMRMRSALMAALYEKQLKLSSLGRRRHSTGEIVNYIAVDAYRMGEFPWWFHSIWSFTFQLFLSIGILFLVIGIGALPGLVPLFIFGLLNVPFAKVLQNCQTKFMNAQDERLRATSEILNNVKIIKLQSWEEKFKKSIDSRRDEEFKWLTESQLKRAYGTALYWMSPTVISSVIFLGCVLLGSAPLDAGTIFTVLATLRVIAEPVRMIPEALSALIQVKVSFDRINTFLLDDELKGDRMKNNMSSSSDTSVEITSGNFTWNTESACSTIRNIDFEVKVGQKIAVCGPVGAGKSSLLYAILGEIVKTSGTVSVKGPIAYVSQAAWIQSGTVRDNILFGKPMDEERYEKAIKSCALDKDISIFDHGDLTEIGQRGINMSGGQKQRIQLARAVYNDADIYLLDDPFSAVDAHTAAALFKDCVMSALAEKTVILVTHQVEFLSEVDRIMVMEGGEITHSGSYQELFTAGTTFEQLVNAHKEAITTLEPANNSEMKEKLYHQPPPKVTKNEGGDEISDKGLQGVGPQLTEEEETEIGDVGLKPFFDYFQVSRAAVLLLLATAAQFAFVVFQAAATYWLAVAIQFPDMKSNIIIGVYTGISTLSAVFVYLRSFIAAHMGLRASKAFFSGFNNAIFRAPMLFFDSTPVGRILTRASSDLSVLDFDIPFTIIFIISSGLELIGTIAIMALVTWQVLIVAILAGIASKYVQDYYLASARELMRINGTTKAPVMSYTAETSLGAVTVRAFNMVDRFFGNFLNLIDKDAKLFFHSNAVMEWLILRIEALQYVTLCTAAVFLVLLPKGNVTTGLVGLSLSYALSLTNTQVFWTRWYCYLSNYIVSVERIKQFMHIPSEPEAIVEDHRPSLWPSKGRIELEDLKLRYRPNAPLVLKGISCIFKEGSRVGVVGRTGSGKTTLISALFRLVDPASGRICVDGIDITSIGLKDLRMKLSIIPQEPTLFRGSVRTNMDPLGLSSDHEIWEALEKCQLKATISTLPNQLDASVSDEGENWSVGQRQLFCLGRVLLRKNRILVLDEATASIDSATDAVLQRVIRQDFLECTVITVAHRVPTVIDSDMVMVLSFGRMVEYDEPWKLMESNSYFSKLVEEYWSSCRKNFPPKA